MDFLPVPPPPQIFRDPSQTIEPQLGRIPHGFLKSQRADLKIKQNFLWSKISCL
jgi:hypothetical protein